MRCIESCWRAQARCSFKAVQRRIRLWCKIARQLLKHGFWKNAVQTTWDAAQSRNIRRQANAEQHLKRTLHQPAVCGDAGQEVFKPLCLRLRELEHLYLLRRQAPRRPTASSRGTMLENVLPMVAEID